jgi:hypothetical protein
MLSTAKDTFFHRANPDGSFDSICKRCFQTIASCESEALLVQAESRHSCDGPLLHLGRILDYNSAVTVTFNSAEG